MQRYLPGASIPKPFQEVFKKAEVKPHRTEHWGGLRLFSVPPLPTTESRLGQSMKQQNPAIRWVLMVHDVR